MYKVRRQTVRPVVTIEDVIDTIERNRNVWVNLDRIAKQYGVDTKELLYPLMEHGYKIKYESGYSRPGHHINRPKQVPEEITEPVPETAAETVSETETEPKQKEETINGTV